MEKDAIPAGNSDIGGLVSTADIRILICYLLTAIKEPIPGQMMADVLHYEGLANYFEVSDAIEYLLKGGHIKTVDEKENTYTATASGQNIAEELKTSLSMTIRDRAYSAVLKMLVQFKNAKETDITITHENGTTYITCTAKDGERPFLSVKLLVTDNEQALYIKKKFLSSTDIYAKIMDLVTK